MSRLTAHQQKEENKKIMYLIGGFIVFLIFCLTFGLRFLINSVELVNKATTTEPTVAENSSDDFYGTVSLDNAPDATNSAQIYIDGTVNGFETLEFYINGTEVKTVSIGSKSQFSEKVTGLQKGNNEIYVKAISDKHNQTKTTDTETVFYKADKLDLEITEPSDGATVRTEETKIAGKTDAGSTVTVNGSPVVVDSSGTFQTLLKLKEGDNTVTVNAEDVGGNTLEKTITVKYQKDD